MYTTHIRTIIHSPFYPHNICYTHIDSNYIVFEFIKITILTLCYNFHRFAYCIYKQIFAWIRIICPCLYSVEKSFYAILQINIIL